MTHSSILREHLTVLHCAQLLKDYIIATRGAGSALDLAAERKADSALEDKAIPAAEADPDDCVKEGTDSEMQALTDGPMDGPTDNLSDASLIILWMFRLHASHFTALDGLLSFFQDKPLTDRTVHICLLTVRSFRPFEVEWEPVLHRVFQNYTVNHRSSEITDIICAELTDVAPYHFASFSITLPTEIPRISCAVPPLESAQALAYLINNFDNAISKSNIDFDWFKVCFLLFFSSMI